MSDIVYSRVLWDLLSKNEGLGPHYHLYQSHCVIRVPIAGPNGYNTLVIVRGFAPMGLPHRDVDKIKRDHFTVRSNFVLQGYDQRKKADYPHSTTAALSYMFASTDFAFTYAVDKIDARFIDGGRWVIDIDTAAKGAAASTPFETQSVMFGWIHFSSWILCWEADVNPSNPGSLELGPIPQPVEL